MATNPRTTISDRAPLTVVNPDRKATQMQSTLLKKRLVTTAIALVVLALVLRYLPSRTRSAQAHDTQAIAVEQPSDLRVTSKQITRPLASDEVFIDGMVTNKGTERVKAATAQVDFYDRQGVLVSSVKAPLVGMSHAGTDIVGNEFARHPIGPNEMRFFRIAVENVPPNWNHEIPDVKITELTAE